MGERNTGRARHGVYVSWSGMIRGHDAGLPLSIRGKSIREFKPRQVEGIARGGRSA